MCGFRGGGGTGGPDSSENHKNIGFSSITGRDILKITKLQSQHSMWAIIGLPAKRHFNGVSLVGRLLPAYGGFWSLAPLEKTKQTKTILSEVDPLCQNFLDPRMMFQILYLEEFIQSLVLKSLKLTLLLKIIYI